MSNQAGLTAAKWSFKQQTVAGRSNDSGYTREKDDFFPTPARATHALLCAEEFDGSIWEPACGDGAISEELIHRGGYTVVSTDLVDRGYGKARVDFLMEPVALAPNIVTNPPFKLALPFARKAIFLRTRKVAMLLKLAFLEGNERREFFEETPLARVWVFSRRLGFPKTKNGCVSAGGMISFAWFIWDHQHKGPPTLGWLE